MRHILNGLRYLRDITRDSVAQLLRRHIAGASVQLAEVDGLVGGHLGDERRPAVLSVFPAQLL